MKTCSKCGGEKPPSDFHKNRTCKDGLHSWCKTCRAKRDKHAPEYSKKYYRDHREKILKYQKENWKKYSQTEGGKEASQRSIRKYQMKYPERMKANRAVNNAIRGGKLTRPTTCESCKKRRFVHGHHEDYINRPLDIDWLCRECHIELHRLLRSELCVTPFMEK